MLDTNTMGFDEIINNTKLISELGYFELLILVTVILLLSLSIFYFIPLIQIKFKLNKLKKDAFNRKKLLNQIITQKEIEEEVEEEIKKLNLKN